eukprot:gene50939-19192_t
MEEFFLAGEGSGPGHAAGDKALAGLARRGTLASITKTDERDED